MFPTTSSTVSKNLLGDNYSGRTTMYEIGEEEQSEQLIQILNSEEIRDRIIEKYNLMAHYGIEKDIKYPMTELHAAYKSNINFELTQYLSVIISVYDADPQIAADIANDISSLVDTVYNKMLKQRAIEGAVLVKKEYDEMLKAYTAIEDSMDIIRSLGVINYEAQAERYHEALGKAINDGNKSAQKIFEEKLAILAKYGGAYVDTRDELNLMIQRLATMDKRYKEAQLEAEQDLSHIFIVDTATVSEKKAYPKKSIIVIISVLSAFLLTLITLIITENIKKKVKA